jgi:hypothetical protein
MPPKQGIPELSTPQIFQGEHLGPEWPTPRTLPHNYCCMATFLHFTWTPYWAHSAPLTLDVTLHLLFVNKFWESPLATKQQPGESKYVKLIVVRFFAS